MTNETKDTISERPYSAMIRAVLAEIDEADLDERLVEGWMRVGNVALDGMSTEEFREQVADAAGCVRIAEREHSVELARSFGLWPAGAGVDDGLTAQGDRAEERAPTGGPGRRRPAGVGLALMPADTPCLSVEEFYAALDEHTTGGPLYRWADALIDQQDDEVEPLEIQVDLDPEVHLVDDDNGNIIGAYVTCAVWVSAERALAVGKAKEKGQKDNEYDDEED